MKTFVLKSSLIVLAAATFVVSSCKKETAKFDSEVKTKTAILHYTRSYAVDGCGYFLDIDSKQYKPDNEEIIDTLGATEDVTVIVEFQYLENSIFTNCGDARKPLEHKGVHLISIKEK
tara:strand:+ start:1204 stop:1557 length:354 start_codon:yes stop_codon:yes gene_type:complete